MKVTLKTLGNKKYELEVEESQTVQDVKIAINATHGLGEPELLKLIYTGKILKDDQTIGSAKIKEGAFVVVMVSKKKKKPVAVPVAAPAEAAEAAEAAATTTESSSAAAAPEAAPAEAAAEPQSQPAPAAVAPEQPPSDSDLVRGPQYEAAVQSLMALGFERPMVVSALRASFNNPDRAAEYLFTGIPEGLMAPSQPQPDAANAQQAVPSAQAEAAESGGTAEQNQVQLDIEGLQQMFQQRPELVDALLQQLAQTQPQLMQVIGQNREAFSRMLQDPQMLTQLLNSGVLSLGPSAPPQRIQVTEEERQAIERLAALGFSHERVLEAYLACDKNEELAANYLFDSGNDGDDSMYDTGA